MATLDLRTGLEVLDQDMCFDLMKSQKVGRLACIIGDRPWIFPMNFAVDGGAVYMRSEEGMKVQAVEGGDVAFEVDSFTTQFEAGWSIIIHGSLERLEDPAEVHRAELLGLRAWSQSGKPHWLRIDASEVTGRRVIQGADAHTD